MKWIKHKDGNPRIGCAFIKEDGKRGTFTRPVPVLQCTDDETIEKFVRVIEQEVQMEYAKRHYAHVSEPEPPSVAAASNKEAASSG